MNEPYPEYERPIHVRWEWELVDGVWHRRRDVNLVVMGYQDTPMDVVRSIRSLLPTENNVAALEVESIFGTFYLIVTHRSVEGLTVHERVHNEKYVLGPTPPTSPASAV